MFRKSQHFHALSILVLEYVPLTDDDLLHIHHLQSLEELNLNYTDVCDTGYAPLCRDLNFIYLLARVFYLVALRHTLTTLKLRGNKSVTDKALPALLLLSHLRVLGLRGTIISMAGLRLLVPFSDRLFLDVPADCEAYLDSESHISFFAESALTTGVALHTQYLLSPLPPLITEPEVVSTLERAALKRNLSAHAAYNSAICTTGNKSVLCTQLIDILERRQGDLAVREMVWRSREPREPEDGPEPGKSTGST